MSKMLEAALRYEEMGWSVIPIARDGSKAALVSWSEFQERRATRDEIKAWWKRWPKANVGVLTGAISGFVVIDVDTDNGADPGPLLDAAPTGIVQATPSGGRHLLYAYPIDGDTVPNRTGIIQGVDVRGDGGLILVPPSVSPNGASYEWLEQGELGDLPRPMLQSIRTASKYEEDEEEDSPTWVRDLLINGAEQGRRNDSATRLAGYFIKKGIPKDVVQTLVNDWNLSSNDPPLADKEVRTIVNSVWKTERRTIRRTGTSRGELERQSNGDAVPRRLGFIPLQDYVVEHADALVEWTVDGWLPQGTIAFLVAAPESFKTWLLLDLAVSVAGGKPFLGHYPVNKSGPVLLIQQEDFHGGLVERIASITYSRFSLGVDEATDDGFTFTAPPVLPIYVHPDRGLKFDNPAVMDELEMAIAQIRPAVVLIDPLYSAASQEEYMAKSVEHMFRLKHLRDKYGCSFVLAHHTSKGKTENTDREGGWGSQFLNAFLETGWQIRRVPEMRNTVKIRRHFKVVESKDESLFKFKINTEAAPYFYEVEQTVNQSEDDSNSIVTLLMNEGPKSVTEVTEALGGARPTIDRRLKAMEKDGLITRMPDKRYAVIQIQQDF